MTGLDAYFFESLWPGLVLWGVLYISDYYFTLTCARLYQRGVREKIEFEGSYEITPYFQADINSLRAISPRFIAAFLWTEASLAAAWWLSWQSAMPIYQIVFGGMVSVELAIHIRHFRNLFLFRGIASKDAVQGRIRYPRPLSLRMSAVELYGFAALFLVISVFTESWFTVGGAMSCFVTATKHLRLAHKAASSKVSEARSVAVAGS